MRLFFPFGQTVAVTKIRPDFFLHYSYRISFIIWKVQLRLNFQNFLCFSFYWYSMCFSAFVTSEASFVA